MMVVAALFLFEEKFTYCWVIFFQIPSASKNHAQEIDFLVSLVIEVELESIIQ